METLTHWGSIYIHEGAIINIENSDTIQKGVNVTLAGKGSVLNIYNSADKAYYLGDLNVIGVNSIIRFVTGGSKLFLDDLNILRHAELILGNFIPSYGDGLFVKKTSKHLHDALSKIRISGELGTAGVRDYNHDYWEIGVGTGFNPLPTPEPSTCGVVFSLGALGFVAWRRRGRRALASVL